MIVTETEIAYLAGIIDGEGTLTLEKKHGTGPYADRLYLRPLVHVTNTDMVLLDWIQVRFGGYLHPQPIGRAAERSKPCYRLTWGGTKALPLLDAVAPYLVSKRAQADVLFRHAATGDWRGKPIPTEVHAERAALLTEIRALNKKGI